MCACSQTHMGPCMCRNQKTTSDVILRPSLLWSPPLWLAGPASEPAGPPGLLPPPLDLQACHTIAKIGEM